MSDPNDFEQPDYAVGTGLLINVLCAALATTVGLAMAVLWSVFG